VSKLPGILPVPIVSAEIVWGVITNRVVIVGTRGRSSEVAHKRAPIVSIRKSPRRPRRTATGRRAA
jgi:hypothetical protein